MFLPVQFAWELSGFRVSQADINRSGIFLSPCVGAMVMSNCTVLSIAAAVGEEASCEVDVNNNELRTELCGDALEIGGGRVAIGKALFQISRCWMQLPNFLSKEVEARHQASCQISTTCWVHPRLFAWTSMRHNKSVNCERQYRCFRPILDFGSTSNPYNININKE